MRRHGWRTMGLALLLGAVLPIAPARAQQQSILTPVPLEAAKYGAGTSDQGGADGQVDLAVASLSAQRQAAIAGQNSDPDSLQGILDRLEDTEADLAELRKRAAQSTDRPQTSLLTAFQPPSASGAPQMNAMDRIQALERAAKVNKDQLPFVRLSGFFQEDTGWFNQDGASKKQLGEVQNGTGFRRARLQALGKLSEFTNFSLEMDFAFPGRPSFMDVWGEQTNLPLGSVRIGQFRQPVTMDSWTSIRHLEFLERSAPFMAFDPFRRVGIMDWWNSESGNSLLAFSIYAAGWTFWNSPQNGAANQTQANILGFDNRFGTNLGNGAALALRGSHLLYYDEPSQGRYLTHVGGGYNASQIGDNPSQLGGGTYRATTIPEFFVGDQAGLGSTLAGTPNVLDTGRFKAHNYQLVHLEYATNYGSLHAQAEWMGTAVAQNGGPLVYYNGAYAQVGYFLTGESAGYNKMMGAMDYNCKPFSEFFGLGPRRGICGWGAWEIAARWSYLDLQTNRIEGKNYVAGTVLGTPQTQTINGTVYGIGPSATNPNPGILNEATLALNWYWNQFTRVQFNVIFCDLSSQYVAAGFSHQSLMEIYTMRYQIEF